MIRAFGFAVAVAVACGGCGSGAQTGAPNTDGLFSTCSTETRAMPYMSALPVKMQVTASGGDPDASAGGSFAIKLLASVPGPPVKGNNVWTVEVDETNTGAPVDGLNITVTPWMPDHGHGTNPVVVTPAGSGTYTLAPMYLYMSGYWEVTVALGGGVVGAGTDSAILPVCIP